MKIVPYTSNEIPKILESRELNEPFVEDVYEIADEPLKSLSNRLCKHDKVVRRCTVNWSRWDEDKSGTLLGSDRKNEIDHVYGLYLSDNGTMFGNKRFDIDTDDSMIIDRVKYKDTPGLPELIFIRIPDDAVYTEDEK